MGFDSGSYPGHSQAGRDPRWQQQQWQPPQQPDPRDGGRQWLPEPRRQPPPSQYQPQPAQWQQYPVQQWQQPVMVAPKSPATGLLLGLLLPGLGCMVNGRAGLGVAILACWLLSLVSVLFLIGWLLAPACWIWSGIAGYMTAQSWNREHGIIS